MGGLEAGECHQLDIGLAVGDGFGSCPYHYSFALQRVPYGFYGFGGRVVVFGEMAEKEEQTVCAL